MQGVGTMTPEQLSDAARASHARTCKGKYVFHSRRDARRSARKVPYGVNLQPYRCSYCSNWHLDHKLSVRKETK